MAETTLRAYLKEIDDLIDHNQLDEAVAHCRQILAFYPKNLNALRLLGKAYLEQGRHGDAADVLQRVLSAVPDDFVAHVGMGIIREDEGNLDSAIYHMERAYEANPSNAAIQEELRRLFGRRDGMEPPRIRLTRGALARMYKNGDLFPQAIAELRTTLAENPDRPDLQVLLAEVYWRADQRVEAAETCNQLLSRLPYCRDANRILADIWDTSGRKEEATVYRKRLEALDPYEAYANGKALSQVDASVVHIQRLDYDPSALASEQAAVQPDWATSLGVSFDEAASPAPEAEALPDWLLETSAGDQAPAAEEVPATPSSDLPDWIEDARASAEEKEAPQTEVEPDTDLLADAPDWLVNLGTAGAVTPVESSDAVPAAEPLSRAPQPEAPDWLAATDAGETAGPSEAAPAPEPPVSETAAPPEPPDWLAVPGLEVEPQEGPETLPPVEATPSAGVEAAPPGPELPIPDFLREAGWGETGGESVEEPVTFDDEAPVDEGGLAPAEVPDWLQAMAPAEAPASAGEEFSEETQKWLEGLDTAAIEQPPETEEATMEAPEWLRPPRKEEDEEVEAEEEKLPEPPAWLEESRPGSTDTIRIFLQDKPAAVPPVTGPLPTDQEREPPEGSDLPEWLREAAEGPAEPVEVDQPASELPEWLRTAVDTERGAGHPDEVRDQIESGAGPFVGTADLPPAPILPAAISEGADEEPEVWVSPEQPEDLRRRAPELSVEPGDQAAGKPPREEEQPGAPAVEPEPAPEAPLPETPAGPEAPPTPVPVPEAFTPGEAEALPDWLTGAAAREEPAPEAPPPADVLPETVPEALAPTEPEPAAGIPTAEVEAPPEAGIPAEVPPTEDADAGLAWLEALARKQGAAEEELVTEPGAASAAAPDWIAAMAAEEEEEPAPAIPAPAEVPSGTTPEAEAPAAEAEALPDWLARVAAEEPVPEAPVSVEAPVEPEPDLEFPPPAAFEPEPEPIVAEAPVEPEPISPEELPAPAPELAAPPVPEPEPVAVTPEPEPVPEAPAPAPPARKKVAARVEPETLLASARAHMSAADLPQALEDYNGLIKASAMLDEVIADLQQAAEQNGNDPNLLQTLGDAYMKDNQLQKALDAYRGALEML